MPPAPLPSERRTVTVLFSDLQGFTSLSEGSDPEEVRELIEALFTRLRAAIEAQGGTVDKFIGDAVMAVFGGEQAHEDDALRAVRAGLVMQSEIASFNQEKSLSLELRIGINSGEVVYGAIAGEKATVMGDAVNVAQRLEAACRPGGILISAAVERATRGSVRTTRLDEITLKGRQERVQPYEATGLLVTDRRYRRAGAEARPMIGRERELSRLRALFEARKPAFVLIEGEAGIGKSRLIWEFHQYLTGVEDGVSWNLGHCREMGPLPMDPWAEMLRKRARRTWP
ncbi:MAG: adenylate/guanylate cyclase domain-containing protein [Planctomycetes bacterium]|nr:adenylate/guanylate cyclase domain-containing protein [Planctomycetota bacterium]